MKKVLLLLLAMAALASAQTASVQIDANGNVLNFQSPSTKAVNFPTGKLTVNGVQITGAVSDGDKGDITVSGSGATWTIDAKTISLAKMADMATASFLGRNTAGTSSPEVLSISTVKIMLGIAGTFGTAAYVNTGTTNGTVPLLGAGGHLSNATMPLGAQLYDNAGTPVIAADFGARLLKANDGTTTAIDWSDSGVVAFGVGIAASQGIKSNSDGFISINSDNRQLIANDGSTVALDWSDPTKVAGIAFQGNGSLLTDLVGDDTAYDATSWNGNTGVATKNAVRDKFESLTITSAPALSISGQTGLLTFIGLASTNRTKTVRDASDTILELGGSYTPTGTWTNLILVTPALGTPASGVVTNLTGTASININGTVGATTPASGAFTSETFTLSLKSMTALATPSALSATQFTGFASTVSGASIMGYGTSNDVSLMNRAGTVVLGVGPNTTLVNIPGTLSVAGHTTFEGVTSTGATGTGKYVYDASPSVGSPTFTGTIGGTPAWSSSQAITLSTAAQPNITSLGNLTSLTVSGDISLFGTTTAPSTDASYAILAVGPNQTIQGFHTLQANAAILISQNASLAAGATWKYISTDSATNYYQTLGTHVFRVAPSGTAGNAITWTNVLSMGSGGVSLLGTNTNDNAAAGNVGEYVSASVVQGSATALTTATPKTVASISLTAGDWDVTAIGALTGASTGTEFDVAIGTTTNSLTGTVLGNTRCQTPTVSLTGADASLMVPDVRVSISSTTTYYLIVQETFTVGSPAAYGRISARRTR